MQMNEVKCIYMKPKFLASGYFQTMDKGSLLAQEHLHLIAEGENHLLMKAIILKNQWLMNTNGAKSNRRWKPKANNIYYPMDANL